jgi:hypothetical protein
MSKERKALVRLRRQVFEQQRQIEALSRVIEDMVESRDLNLLDANERDPVWPFTHEEFGYVKWQVRAVGSGLPPPIISDLVYSSQREFALVALAPRRR